MKKSEENITRVKIDLDNPPPLTSEQQAQLAALAARPDDEIDYSDIPPLTNLEQFYRPVKEMTTPVENRRLDKPCHSRQFSLLRRIDKMV